jgi:hypothetical protein
MLQVCVSTSTAQCKHEASLKLQVLSLHNLPFWILPQQAIRTWTQPTFFFIGGRELNVTGIPYWVETKIFGFRIFANIVFVFSKKAYENNGNQLW